MSETLITLCGNPEKVGDWSEIEDWPAFEAECRQDPRLAGSAIVYSCMAWTAHKFISETENKPLNPDYEASYKRIRALAADILGEHSVKKIETGIYNAVVNP